MIARTNMDLQLPGSTWLWAIFLVLLLRIIYQWYFSSAYRYWEERGVPYVPGQSVLAALLTLLTKDLSEIENERYKKYGRVYGAFEGRTPTLSVADPDLIRNILVKDFPVFPNRRKMPSANPIIDNMLSIINGETWKRIRSIVSPTFSTGKIKRMTDIIIGSAKTLTMNFASQLGKPIDVKIFFHTFTMDVIASVAFGTKLHSYADPTNRFVQEARRGFPSGIPWRFILLMLCPPRLLKMLRIDIMNAQVMNFFKDETLKIIEYRKKSGKTRNDFLQLMIDAEKEYQQQEKQKMKEKPEEEKNVDDINAEDLGHDENNAEFFKMTASTKFLSQDELIAQCVLFFLGALPTVSSALCFAIYMIALNPEIQNKLQEDVDAAIRNHDGKLTYAGIQEMGYLDRVVTETLRMFPPAIRIERMACEDYKLGDTDIIVEKGKLISIPVLAIHRDPEFYPEPEKFDPERFTAEGKASRHPYSYLTFGAGPRNCVAMRFALMEIKLCIAYIISQLIIKQCPETKVPLEILSTMGILDAKEVTLCFEKRKDRVFDGLQENQNVED